MVPSPDLNLLRIFDMVYTTGAVNLAAEELNMTAPAVSQAMNRLSRQIGQPLFIRQGRGIKPTATAVSLKEQITPHLSILEQSLSSAAVFDPAESHRVFSVGSGQNYDLLYISRLHPLLKQAPNISCEWVPELYQEEARHDALRSRTVDVIITSSPLKSAGFNDELITREPVIAVCARNHPRIESVSTFDGFFRENHTALSGYRMSRLFIDSLALQPLPERKVIYRNDSMLTLMTMAASTDWLCICHAKAARQYAQSLGLHTFELPFETQPLPIYLSWHSARKNDSGLLWLIDKIKTSFDVD